MKRNAYIIRWPQADVFYAADVNMVLWYPDKCPSVFTSKRLADRAVKRSLDYASVHGFGWSADQYELVKLNVVS